MAVQARRRGTPSLADVAARWPCLLPGVVTGLLVIAVYLVPGLLVEPDVGGGATAGQNALLTVQALTFAVVGIVIVWGHPRHLIGRLFIAVGLIVALDLALSAYGYLALQARPDLDLPAGELAAWLQGWLYVLALGIFVMVLPQLFPNGHLVSPRWRPVLWLTLVATLGMVLTDMLRPGRIDRTGVLDNPTAAPADLYAVIEVVAPLLFLLGTVLGFASLAVRWRSADRRQRQQLTLLLLAAAMMPVFVAINGLINRLARGEPFWELVSFTLASLAFLGLPVAVGAAIVRHRLYDIDLVVNRTVVYGLLSALLLAVYVVSVILLQALVGPFLGSSDVAVALSTLAVAALFRPARSRVQAVVDRRFFRRSYSTQRTLADFAGRARDEVDVDSLAADLLATVRRTVQPTSVSLWVPPSVSAR